MSEKLTIRNASEHNLKNISLDIPRKSFTVITGLSGSGKSSLAFDTIFKEGQRRYIASLSAYARQFMSGMDRPAVDLIEGLSPTICIDQKSAGSNPRSTVGTITEIYDFLRLLYSRLAIAYCPNGHGPIAGQTSEMIVDHIVKNYEGRRILIMAPVILERKGEYRKDLDEYKDKGFVRARIDGKVVLLDEKHTLERYEKHTIEIVLDRLTVVASEKSRIEESVKKSLEMAKDKISVFVYHDGGVSANETCPAGEYNIFGTSNACQICGSSIPELEPRLFSFNVSQGACPECDGLGYKEEFDPGLFIKDETKSVFEGALYVLNDQGNVLYINSGREEIEAFFKKNRQKITTHWRELSNSFKTKLLIGGPEGSDTFNLKSVLEWTYEKWNITNLQRYMRTDVCELCHGHRLNPIASHVLFRGKPIYELTKLQVKDLYKWLGAVEFEGSEKLIGEPIFFEILERLQFLMNVGLDYLTLERRSNTLSGGEAQRIRLAAQIGSGLEGCLYILDEPSIGLHQCDNKKLIHTLKKLRDKSNTVFVIEHDEETMLNADHIVDIGPGAGRQGGKICFNGTPSELLSPNNKKSFSKKGFAEKETVAKINSGKQCCHTRDYLTGEKRIELPLHRRTSDRFLSLKGARRHNLKGIDFNLPLGIFNVITGVSGSGKSTLIMDVLCGSVASLLDKRAPVYCDSVKNLSEIDKLIEIDQAPIGRTPRSNPATYTKAMDCIRDLFAAVPEARMRAYAKGRFSFNVKGGRCEHCGGAGVTLAETRLFSTAEVVCEVCNGKRFNRNTLDIHYKGKTIYDVLEMTIGEACEFFSAIPKLKDILTLLNEMGMDYVKLGQPSTTLSGGEAQRIKLASELSKRSTGKTIYVLDEPTTGLHFEDIQKLLHSLNRLVEGGNTVVVIEHNLDIIKSADHVTELGPGGGEDGGIIVGEGPPEKLAGLTTPTGAELKLYLDRYHKRKSNYYIENPQKLLEETQVGKDSVTIQNASSDTERFIKIKGLRKNNLKNISLEIPKSKLVAITGVSGSGKSSLAFDTLFQEGQRKYMESLSTYARRFLGRIPRAQADVIEGISPTIAVDQMSGSKNPRSTVATQTELYDSLRVLFANSGKLHCPVCKDLMTGWTPAALASKLVEEKGKTFLFKTPLWSSEISRHFLVEDLSRLKALVPVLSERGDLRLEIDGESFRLDDPEIADKLPEPKREVLLVIDRITMKHEERSRIEEAIEKGYDRGEGVVIVELVLNQNNKLGRTASSIPAGSRRIFSSFPACFEHNQFFEDKLTPRHFSFNHHLGACPKCQGIGVARVFSEKRFIVDGDLPLLGGAMYEKVSPFFTRRGQFYGAALKKIARDNDIDLYDRPWEHLNSAQKKFILYGLPLHGYTAGDNWKGIQYIIEDLHGRSESDRWRDAFAHCLDFETCPVCHGGRLSPQLLSVYVAEKNIAQICAMNIEQVAEFFKTIQTKLDFRDIKISKEVIEEINFRLSQMLKLGLYYISLDRNMGTLSGGEAQRIRLSTQIGNKLGDVIYVLDEPTIGLHERDTAQLLAAMKELVSRKNTVIVVEHDGKVIEKADHIVDIGPGAGDEGGTICYEGAFKLAEMKGSSIYPYLGKKKKSADRFLCYRKNIIDTKTRPHMVFTGVEKNNLKGIDMKFPLGAITGISGVSGSGKSSLLEWALPRLQECLSRAEVGKNPEVFFIDENGKWLKTIPLLSMVMVDQTPVTTSLRSITASYIGVFDEIRKVFAGSRDAKERGWDAGYFSFNSKKGQCPRCCGKGEEEIEMHFISDVTIPCESCGGKRFGREVLSVYYKQKNIADVLDMTYNEAIAFFESFPKIVKIMQNMIDAGLGYLKLGLKTTTLSGGELQRLKIASELAKKEAGAGTLYILDEPTTGLHYADVEKLAGALDRLVSVGSTVIAVEHNVEFLRNCDHLIDLGPEGGDGGGEVVVSGSPSEVAESGKGYTAGYL